MTRISSFASVLTVISSKQRPRRLSMKGSDGNDYQFLLKGHEDLRQDERVMQLFGLVNGLLMVDTDCFKRRLHIQRFSVIPLAPQAGLLGWVNDSDTLHVLVKEYRDSRKVLIDIERRLMLQVSFPPTTSEPLLIVVLNRWHQTTKTSSYSKKSKSSSTPSRTQPARTSTACSG